MAMSELYMPVFFTFFFNDTATTEIYTLSLHDALPISYGGDCPVSHRAGGGSQRASPQSLPTGEGAGGIRRPGDRKSTRLNSSHVRISYAVFCLKKKKKDNDHTHSTSRLY